MMKYAEPWVFTESLSHLEGGAAVIKTTAARLRKDPSSWTEQQGKAVRLADKGYRSKTRCRANRLDGHNHVIRPHHSQAFPGG